MANVGTVRQPAQWDKDGKVQESLDRFAVLVDDAVDHDGPQGDPHVLHHRIEHGHPNGRLLKFVQIEDRVAHQAQDANGDCQVPQRLQILKKKQ